MSRFISISFGIFCYLGFLGCLLYLGGFLANYLVPKSIDSGESGTLLSAVIIDIFLVALFALQHSVMARQGFKRVWKKLIPVQLERSVYVLVTCLVLVTIFVGWQPIRISVWHAESPLMVTLGWSVYLFGFALVAMSTFMIDHFELFGLRQVFSHFFNKRFKHTRFQVNWLYRFVRHPLYLGWLLVFWGTPDMTFGHFIFSIGMSTYILIAIVYEERDMVSFHGQEYLRYQQNVPKLIPKVGNGYTQENLSEKTSRLE